MNQDEAIYRRMMLQMENVMDGEAVPSERALAEAEGVSRGVARLALQRLARAGRIVAVARSGYETLLPRRVVRLSRGGGVRPDALADLEWREEAPKSDCTVGAEAVNGDRRVVRTGWLHDTLAARDEWRFPTETASASATLARVMGGADRLWITGVTDIYYNIERSEALLPEPWLRNRSEGRNGDGALVFERTLLLCPDAFCLTWGEEGVR